MSAHLYLNRMDPLMEMSRIQEEMNRLFNDTFGTGAAGFPPVNVWSDADEAWVTVELPGVNPADIRLSARDDELMMEGERKEFQVKEGEEVHRQERNFGAFKRSAPLPFKVDPSRIDAKYKNGILTVRLPRHEAEKPRKIQIAATA
jgi:HSP20 family protein